MLPVQGSAQRTVTLARWPSGVVLVAAVTQMGAGLGIFGELPGVVGRIDMFGVALAFLVAAVPNVAAIVLAIVALSRRGAVGGAYLPPFAFGSASGT
ncbi:hypothetical protein AB0I60_19595 [Actinosynnema sp. NPDC050436]|uniref:hypothetical protein n=1 Tax=Actinosynnema sp. NPDC050436 TaxID=3155659 RepID=UPI0033DEF1D0